MEKAVKQEAKNRAAEFLTGILRYVEAPYSRELPEPPAIWHRGNARLLDYGLQSNKKGYRPIVLFIPSLINRYYILDLETERSMLRYLANKGFYPLVLDWDEPGEWEKSFGCSEYITDILLGAAEFLTNISKQQIILAGYCMGGNLALAAAQLKPNYFSGLVLLATPWDFHCQAFAPFVVGQQWLEFIESQIATRDTLPADIIQSLFYMTDPWVFEQKFRRFANLDPESQDAQEFVALERWVNDGVPMTAKVAKDCMIGWAQKNQLMKGEWRVGSKIIDPNKITLPTFIAIPKSDHVVPIDCAMPLAEAMKQAKVIRPSSGHVGMVVGHKAEKELWNPLVKWIATLA